MSDTAATLLSDFATSVASQVATSGLTAYSYESNLSGNDTASTPGSDPAEAVPVADPSDPAGGYVYTDCSGWVAYALDSVAPLHQAVAATARTGAAFNHDDFAEATRTGWARAFVLTNLFTGADGSNGYQSVSSFANLQAGDLIAYAIGDYTDPSGTTTPPAGDTGHTMIVVGPPQIVTDPDAMGMKARSPDVTTVYAVQVVDSSDLVHFAPPDGDARNFEHMPSSMPSWLTGDKGNSAHAGGTGLGVMWFGTDSAGHVLQFRFAGGDNWQPPSGTAEQVSITAARLTGTINLSDTVLDAGWLDARVYPNASPAAGGLAGTAQERLTGTGNLRVTGAGQLSLGADNSYVGTTDVGTGTTLQLTSAKSLGDAANTVSLEDGAVLGVTADMTMPQNIAPLASATLDLGGHLLQLTGDLQAGSGTTLTLSSTGTTGGELQVDGDGGTGLLVVGSGATLSFTGYGEVAGHVALDDGAALHIHHSSSLSQLSVSGTADLRLEDQSALTLTNGIAVPTTDSTFGKLTISGDGTLTLKHGGATEATLASGQTLYAGTLAQFDGQVLSGFKAGDLIDVTDLPPVNGGSSTAGVTAAYDDATGNLVLAQGGRNATLQLPTGLTDAVPDPTLPGSTTHQELTVRTDGAGGSLVGTATATGNQDSTALNAAQTGATGAGVVVGVISDSFDTLGGMAQDIANGALPQDTTVLHDSGHTASDEGRSMARIVHSIAPGASILFDESELNANSSAEHGQGLANAIMDLADNGAKVIVDDISVSDDQIYQPGGVVAQAVAYAAAKGAVLLTSAGNQGNNFYEHAFTLAPTTADGLGGAYAYDFGQGSGTYMEEIDLHPTSKNAVTVALGWDQPTQAPGYTLNVGIYRFENGAYVPAQNVSYAVADPLDLNVRSATIDGVGDGGKYYIAVTGSAAASGTLKLVVTNQGYETSFTDTAAYSGSGAIYGHAQDPQEIAVGAVNWKAAPAYGLQPFSNETFSASGKGVYVFDADGNRLDTPLVLDKPDVSGVDGVPQDTNGTSLDFLGTSAAAPSVAGVAALMLSVNKLLTADQVKAGLQASAISMSGAAAGSGLVQANAAVALARIPVISSITAAADLAGVTLGAGHSVAFTLTTSLPLQVQAGSDGSLPTLTLNDGGTAVLDSSASSGTSLVFRTTIASGQDSANLSVTGLAATQATLANAIGVQLPAGGLGGVPGAATGIVVDTTPAPTPTPAPAPIPSVPQPTVTLAGTAPGIITNGNLINVAGTAAPGATIAVTANGVAGAVTPLSGGSYQATVAPPLAGGMQQVNLAVTASLGAASASATATVGVDMLPAPVGNVTSANLSSSDLRQVLDQGWQFAFQPGTQAVQLTNGTLSVGTDTNQAVVQRLYEGLLSRSADTAGLTGFTQMLAAGSGAVAVAGALMASAEYAAGGVPASSDTIFVQGAYAGFLGRAPAASELSDWTGMLGAGTNRATVAAAFATAPESKAYLTASTADLWTPDANGQLVTQLYQTGLDRAPLMPEVSAWTAQLQAGLTPQQVAQTIAASAEFGAVHTGQSPTDLVTGLYTAGLGRPPDAAGLQAWTQQIGGGMTPATMLLAIATSPEGDSHLSPTV